MSSKIWLSSPNMGGDEKDFIKQAFDENWVAPVGPNIDAFEKNICKYNNINHAAAVSSGTAAIHLALILLGVQSGDEVLCSSFTFSASANPIRYQLATPIFVDSEEETWNIDPILLEKAIIDRTKNGKKPKALILVHLYGISAKMKEILSVCEKYEIPIIEDAAEALGSLYKDKALGTFGKFGVYSFNGNKIITTSGGGMLVSNDKKLIEKAKFLSSQARDEAPHYQHSQVGYNYRMSNISAGIGRGQMQVLDLRVSQKRKIRGFYEKIFDGIKGIKILKDNSSSFSNAWLSCILIDPKKTKFTREKLRLAFEKDNIEARPLWKPMHLQPVFENFPSYLNGVSEKLFLQGLCLPSDTNMKENEFKRVEKVINNVLKKVK